MLAAAWLSERAGTPAVRVRTRADAVTGAAVVLALYAVTALLNDVPTTVSVVLVGAIAVAVWAWWDPSPGALAVAAGAAVLGPLAEIAVVAAGASSLRGAAPTAWPAWRRGCPACTSPPAPWPPGCGRRCADAGLSLSPGAHGHQVLLLEPGLLRRCRGSTRRRTRRARASNSSSRPSFSAFARAAIVGP